MMMSTPNDNEQLDVGESSLDISKSSSRGDLEGSLSLLDVVSRKENGTVSRDQGSVSSGTSLSVSKRLSESLLGRVSKFNANPTDGNFLSPMQSLKEPIFNSTSRSPRDQSKVSPVVRRSAPNKIFETRIKNFEVNLSPRDYGKLDLRSPEEVKKLVKSSRDNQRLDPILNRYEHLSEQESQQTRELASKIAARERHRRLGCTKSEKERSKLLKQNRARFFRSGSERILDVEVDGKINDGMNYIEAVNGLVCDEVRAARYDFSDFVSPSFQKSEMQRQLILDVIERSFVFAEFRKHGKARCGGVLDMLVDAFEPVGFPSGHILLRQGVKKENDEFYILERGRIDFEIDGRPVAQIAKVGGYFGELALLYNVTNERMVSVHESSNRETRLLKINQKTFRGILNTCSKKAAKEKRDALLGVDFLYDVINENENMIRRLSSIMIREELKIDDNFSLSKNSTFVVIQSGRVRVADTHEIFESGDYFGSRALMSTPTTQIKDETNMIACSASAIFFRINNDAMKQIVGPSQLQNLMDMRRFAATRLIKNANLSNDAYESMANRISEKNFCADEENTMEVDLNDPPAVYVVREGSLIVSSHDEITGGQMETLVTTGNIFGLDQLKLSTENGEPMYRRLDGLKASVPKGQSTSIGVLPLNNVKLDIEDDLISFVSAQRNGFPCSTDSYVSDNNTNEGSKIESRHSGSPILRLREKVREIVQTTISLQDLEKIRLLGQGEFGEVWLVAADVLGEESTPKKQMFALKSQLKEDENRGMDAIDVIFREIDVMKELRHSQLVDLVNTYEDESSIHMLMRLVPYGELWGLMHVEDDQGNWSSGLPDEHAKFYAMSIADTLNFIHSKGIIYRDLKPENVLIDKDGYPVIVDFGFAKFCPDKTYTFVGTPNYVAPEIITNAGHNRCVDFWAFGVTLYEMVTGENPFFFEGVDHVSLYHSICHEKYFPLPDNQSEAFSDLIDKLLKKDPIERLGMLHGGIEDIFQHQWFDGVELAQIRTKSYPAPWKPTNIIYDGFENLQLEEKATKSKEFSSPVNGSIGSISNTLTGEVQKLRIPSKSKSLNFRSEKKALGKKTNRSLSMNYPNGSPSSEVSNEETLTKSASRSLSMNYPMDPPSSEVSNEEIGEVSKLENQSPENKDLPQSKSALSITESMDSLSNILTNEAILEVQESGTSSESQPRECDELNITSGSKLKSSKRKKKKSKKPHSNKSGSFSNSYDNPSEFQFVSLEQAEPLRRNPAIRRTSSQKKQSQIRRDLLKNSFNNFGID